MNLRSVGLVAKREFLENARTKAFWIGALSVPLVLVISGVAASFFANIRSVDTYAVLDQSGWVHDATRRHIITEDLNEALDVIARRSLSSPADAGDEREVLLGEVRRAIEGDEDREAFLNRGVDLIFTLATESGRIPTPSLAVEKFADWWVSNPDGVADAFGDTSLAYYRERVPSRLDAAHLNSLIEQDRLDGYFVIPEDPVRSSEGARYVTGNLTDQDMSRWYGRSLTEVVQAQRLREENIDADTADWLNEAVSFEAAKPAGTGAETAEDADFIAQWAPIGLVYLLWISVFTINQMLLTSTIEEKSGKLAEVLLSSVSPADLLAGKVAGIGGAGLAIVAVWIATFVAFALAGLGLMARAGGDFDIGPLLNPAFLIGFMVYFLLGYLLYAAIFCAIGSLCNTIQDAQSMMMPMILVLMIPFLLVFPVAMDPNGTLAVVASWIPPLTPFVMLNRMADPPGILTFAGTTVLLAASIWYSLRLGGRVFENGILRTGKPPSLKQIPSLLRG